MNDKRCDRTPPHPPVFLFLGAKTLEYRLNFLYFQLFTKALMKQVASRICLASSITLSCLATISPARAQIASDNTLPVNSIVTPGCTVCRINGGTVPGALN
ncbi:MAG TPA: hypothetical protein V6D14_19200 [Coleofasciculaceae cyanobacterium]